MKPYPEFKIWIASDYSYTFDVVLSMIKQLFHQKTETILCFGDSNIKTAFILRALKMEQHYFEFFLSIQWHELYKYLMTRVLDCKSSDLPTSDQDIFWMTVAELKSTRDMRNLFKEAFEMSAEIKRLSKPYVSLDPILNNTVIQNIYNRIHPANALWNMLSEDSKNGVRPTYGPVALIILGAPYLSTNIVTTLFNISIYYKVYIVFFSVWLLPSSTQYMQAIENIAAPEEDTKTAVSLETIHAFASYVFFIPSIPYIAARAISSQIRNLPFDNNIPLNIWGRQNALNYLQSSLLLYNNTSCTDCEYTAESNIDTSFVAHVFEKNIDAIAYAKKTIFEWISDKEVADITVFMPDDTKLLNLIIAMFLANPHIPAIALDWPIQENNDLCKLFLKIILMLKNKNISIDDVFELVNHPTIYTQLGLSHQEAERISDLLHKSSGLYPNPTRSWDMFVNYFSYEILSGNHVIHTQPLTMMATSIADITIVKQIDDFVTNIKRSFLTDAKQSLLAWKNTLLTIMSTLFGTSIDSSYIALSNCISNNFSSSINPDLTIEEIYILLTKLFTGTHTPSHSINTSTMSAIKIVPISSSYKHIYSHSIIFDLEIDRSPWHLCQSQISRLILNTEATLLYICNKQIYNATPLSRFFIQLSKNLPNKLSALKTHPTPHASKVADIVASSPNILLERLVNIDSAVIDTKSLSEHMQGNSHKLILQILAFKKPFLSSIGCSALPDAQRMVSPFEQPSIKLLWESILSLFSVCPITLLTHSNHEQLLSIIEQTIKQHGLVFEQLFFGEIHIRNLPNDHPAEYKQCSFSDVIKTNRFILRLPSYNFQGLIPELSLKTAISIIHNKSRILIPVLLDVYTFLKIENASYTSSSFTNKLIFTTNLEYLILLSIIAKQKKYDISDFLIISLDKTGSITCSIHNITSESESELESDVTNMFSQTLKDIKAYNISAQALYDENTSNYVSAKPPRFTKYISKTH